MKIAIRGIGVVGGFGCGLADLESTIKNRKSVPAQVSVNMPERTEQIPVFMADTARIESFLPVRSLRRIDHFSRMALLGTHLALKDADQLNRDMTKMGIVVATGYGAMKSTYALKDSIRNNGDTGASPTKFSNSVHNSAAAHIAIFLKINGPNFTVSQFEISIPAALLTACQWLREGRVDSVLFGGVDEFCDVLGYSHKRLYGLNKESVIRPFDFKNQTAVAGEGAVFFLLTRDEGEGSRYCLIEKVITGRLQGDGIKLHDQKCVLVLGVDGNKECASVYEKEISQISKDMKLACYTPLYGSLPVGPGFDIAVTSLGIKNNRIFASPESAAGNSSYNVILKDETLDHRKIGCLKINSRGEYGLIIMSGT